MTTSIYAWSTDAASNASADSAINWSEFQAPDTVNNSARQMMGRVAEVLKDIAPTRTSAGSGNAYTVSTASNIASLVDGTIVYFYADKTNTGSSTLAVNSFGAKPLRARTGTALTGNEILVGTVVGAYYRLAGDEWIITNSGYHTNILVPGLLASQLVSLKVGSVLAWMTDTIPAGWLAAEGQAISRTTYSALFAEYGTRYGAGDGSTTFNLPDLRGQFLRGHANGSSTDPDRTTRTDRGDGTTGDNVGTKQADQTEAHTHGPGSLAGTTNTTGAHTHTVDGASNAIGSSGGAQSTAQRVSVSTSSAGDHSHTVTLSSGVSASTGGNETRPTNVAVKFIVLALPAAASASTLGVNGLLYTWDTGTTDADPGTGKLRLNNATVASATKIFISETGADSAAYGDLIGTWDDSTSTVKGILHFYKVGTLSTYAIFSVSGSVVDDGSYRDVTVTHIASNGTFASGDQLSVLFHRTGDAGTAGSAGAAGADAGIRWNFDTSTSMADPGSADVRFNNATPASVTAIAISANSAESGNPDMSDWIVTWDDSSSTIKGQIVIRDLTAPTVQLVFNVTAVTDNSTWLQLTVAHVAGGTLPSSSDSLSFSFYRTGDQGASGVGTGDVNGPASSVDNEIVLFSGTGGKTIKRASTTGLLKAASGVIDAAVAGTDYVAPGGALGTPSSGTLTNATGLPVSTGISGLGTGVATFLATPSSANLAAALTDETGTGANVFANTPTLVTPILGTPTSGTLTNCTGLPISTGVSGLGSGVATFLATPSVTNLNAAVTGGPVKTAGKETIFVPASAMIARTTNGAASATVELATNDVMLRTLDFDTTTEEGAGFWVAMPKSWNEGTVTFQALWTAATGSGGVAWGLAAYAFSDDDAMDTAVSGQQVVTDTLITTNDMHITAESSAITIGGTPAELDAVYFEITREVANGSDTIAADARLIGVRLFFTTNAATDA